MKIESRKKTVADKIKDTNTAGLRRAKTDNKEVADFYKAMQSIPIQEMDKIKANAKAALNEGLKSYMALGQKSNKDKGYVTEFSEFMKCLYKTLVIWQHQVTLAEESGDLGDIIQTKAMFDLIRENSMQVSMVHEALGYIHRGKPKTPKTRKRSKPTQNVGIYTDIPPGA